MNQILLIALVIVSTLFVILLSFSHLATIQLLQILSVITFSLIVAVYGLRFSSFEAIIVKYTKPFLFLLLTVMTQMIVVITGGLYSPLLFLIHIYIIVSCILFNFRLTVTFAVSSLALLLIISFAGEELTTKLILDPGPTVLYLLSFLTILPLSYLLSKHFSLKGPVAKLLSNQIKVEDAIMESLSELVIITNIHGLILSVNEAAERTLRKSRLELAQKMFFDVVFLKDRKGKLLTKESLTPEKKVTFDNLTLVSMSGAASQKVSLLISPIQNVDGVVDLISLIITPYQTAMPENSDETKAIDEAYVKLDVTNKELQKTLEKSEKAVRLKQIYASKLQSDIIRTYQLKTAPLKKVPIDIAKLTQQIVASRNDYAQLLNVKLSYSLPDFGVQDVKPILSGSFTDTVSPDQMTGPFFTTVTDVVRLSVLLEKLLDLTLLLASDSDGTIAVTIQRAANGLTVAYSVTGSQIASLIHVEKLLTANAPFQIPLLQRGTGLETHLVAQQIDILDIPYSIKLSEDKKTLLFAITLIKRIEPKRENDS